MRMNLHHDMDNVLNTLSVRECGILRARYGLDDGRQRTLEEVGAIFNVRSPLSPTSLYPAPLRGTWVNTLSCFTARLEYIAHVDCIAHTYTQ